ncbi:MAG: hypothetical protein ACRELG_18385 [Gemmataceae bacterium]
MWKRNSYSGWLLVTLRDEWESQKCGDGSHKPDIFPVKLVALLEAFTREQVAMCVEHGQPYVSLCAKLLKDRPFDLVDVWRLRTERDLSFGSYAAYHVQVSSVEQMVGVLDHMLNGGFKKRLGSLAGRAPHMNALSRLFSVRHALCHEALDKRPYGLHENVAFFEAVGWFTKQAFTAVLDALDPGPYQPPWQRMLPELKRQNESVEAAVNAARARPEADPKRLRLIQEEVEGFAHFKAAWCDLAADDARGGTMAHTLSVAEALNLTEQEAERWSHRGRADERRLRGGEPGAYRPVPVKAPDDPAAI